MNILRKSSAGQLASRLIIQTASNSSLIRIIHLASILSERPVS